MSKHTPGLGWTLNGLRFVSEEQHGATQTFHVDDFPIYAAAPELLAALEALLAEWDKLTRYGSPMAKNANESVTFARAALSKARAT